MPHWAGAAPQSSPYICLVAGAIVPLGKPLLDALDRMGFGGVVLEAGGTVRMLNSVATRQLRPNASECVAPCDPQWARAALKSILRSETSSRFTMDADAWVVVPQGQKRPLVMHAISVTEGLEASHTVVVLIDLQARPEPRPEALQKIFGLTPAEANLCVGIAGGKSLGEIASNNKLKVATIRKQLASVFVKTSTRRQGELVALLARLSILP